MAGSVPEPPDQPQPLIFQSFYPQVLLTRSGNGTICRAKLTHPPTTWPS